MVESMGSASPDLEGFLQGLLKRSEIQSVELAELSRLVSQLRDQLVSMNPRREAGTSDLATELEQLRKVHQALLTTNHLNWVRGNEAIARLEEMQNSRSWRITAALRRAKAYLRTRKKLRRAVKGLLRYLIAHLSRYPNLKGVAACFLRPFPSLFDRLRTLSNARQDVQAVGTKPESPHQERIAAPDSILGSLDRSVSLPGLTPRARAIYRKLSIVIRDTRS